MGLEDVSIGFVGGGNFATKNIIQWDVSQAYLNDNEDTTFKLDDYSKLIQNDFQDVAYQKFLEPSEVDIFQRIDF